MIDRRTLLVGSISLFLTFPALGRDQLTDADIAKAIIAECRAAYEAAKARKGAEHPPIGRERLASIIETAERYVLALERMVCSAYTDEQMKHLQKPREAWRKILRDDARVFRWPDEGEAA